MLNIPHIEKVTSGIFCDTDSADDDPGSLQYQEHPCPSLVAIATSD